MAAPDALILSRKAQATVFVVRWADTRREAVHLALRKLAASGGQVTGVVLSMVDVRKYAMYGYGDSGAYHGRLAGYYAG